MRRALRHVAGVMVSLVCVVGCGSHVKAVFRASDPTFQPLPGTKPSVFLVADVADVPRLPMRSVGIIEVTLQEGSEMKAATEVASAKGDEIGCWILVEHSAFARIQARASLDHGAYVLLAHGSSMHAPIVRPGGRPRTLQFDCVLKADALTAREMGSADR